MKILLYGMHQKQIKKNKIIYDTLFPLPRKPTLAVLN